MTTFKKPDLCVALCRHDGMVAAAYYKYAARHGIRVP